MTKKPKADPLYKCWKCGAPFRASDRAAEYSAITVPGGSEKTENSKPHPCELELLQRFANLCNECLAKERPSVNAKMMIDGTPGRDKTFRINGECFVATGSTEVRDKLVCKEYRHESQEYSVWAGHDGRLYTVEGGCFCDLSRLPSDRVTRTVNRQRMCSPIVLGDFQASDVVKINGQEYEATGRDLVFKEANSNSPKYDLVAGRMREFVDNTGDSWLWIDNHGESEHDKCGASEHDHRGTHGRVMREASTDGLFSVPPWDAFGGRSVVASQGA